jgi:hypothetical protein
LRPFAPFLALFVYFCVVVDREVSASRLLCGKQIRKKYDSPPSSPSEALGGYS